MPFDAFHGPIFAVLLPLPLTLAITAIDLRRRIIPDTLNLALLALGLAAMAWRAPDPASVALRASEVGLAFLLLFGLRAFYTRLRGRIGLGLGDVKFIAAATAWTGLPGLPLLILVASVTALAALLVAASAGQLVERTTRLPFGPFLVVGLHATLLADVLQR